LYINLKYKKKQKKAVLISIPIPKEGLFVTITSMGMRIKQRKLIVKLENYLIIT
jgi:hypothetical protein